MRKTSFDGSIAGLALSSLLSAAAAVQSSGSCRPVQTVLMRGGAKPRKRPAGKAVVLKARPADKAAHTFNARADRAAEPRAAAVRGRADRETQARPPERRRAAAASPRFGRPRRYGRGEVRGVEARGIGADLPAGRQVLRRKSFVFKG